ncbi:MAG TPA: Rieske (2Fe-2S) protein [Humisphaera sp.]|jgi:nitrite reductase/ring-hydroxylating ferredoxin subunit|nr:Rieske (2Fe-2S) protein [Humisphaera sp.]
MFEELTDRLELNRRNFLAAATACACALCPAAMALGQQKKDDDDDDDVEELPKVPAGPVDIGPLSNYPKDGIYENFAKSRHMLVIRAGGKLFACSAVCTHKGVLLKEKDGKIFCSKHNSRFTPEGVPTPKPNGAMGPAKTVLVHYGIATNDKGHAIVDTSKPIEQAKWNEPTTFLKV